MKSARALVVVPVVTTSTIIIVAAAFIYMSTAHFQGGDRCEEILREAATARPQTTPNRPSK